MNPYDIAHNLARALRESSEYKEYTKAKEAVDKDESKKTIVDEFRKKQLEMQSLKTFGQDVSDEQMEKLHNLYNLVSMDQEAKTLMQYEQRLGQLLSDIYKIIGDALKIEEPE
jgi:cell fate (sporulation/competence/biofilm development) regulator YlbF (YheA/YmcA/DUF963 family)